MGVKNLAPPKNRFSYCVLLLQHLVVPEPNHSKTCGFQPCGALSIIIRSFQVLPTIHFYDEPILKAYEVNDVRSNRRLSAKSVTQHLAVAYDVPQPLFGVCEVFPEMSRSDCSVHCLHPITPILTFPRQGGRDFVALSPLREESLRQNVREICRNASGLPAKKSA